MYVRKEAVLSSQIEGTQSSLSDLLIFENAHRADREDVGEVVRYVDAMNHGLKRLRTDEFPLSLRLIREMHAKLLAGGRGSSSQPGEFRRMQNRIGGRDLAHADYVPPPPAYVETALQHLENFLHTDEPPLPVLVRAALAHVQFESIHPFLDGNGRIGRLLIPFLLCARGAVREPLLYPSLYFKQHRTRYYELLQGVRTDGDWETWVEFFLRGMAEIAEQAVETARRLQQLVNRDHQRLAALGKARFSAAHGHAAIQKMPIFSIPMLAREATLGYATAERAVRGLVQLGIAAPLEFVQTPKLFVYRAYLDILSEGTEPLPR